MRVYVVNQRNKPLMSTTPRKAKLLLKQGKAKVVQRTPFTIGLLYATGENTQPVSLGIDAGVKHVGISAATEKEVLLEAEVQLRTDIVELLSARRLFRRSRRNRKTRYRKARFLNRKRPEGWLPPSIQNKVSAHINIVNQIHRILPVSRLTVEVAQFDIQKIKNTDISGEGYQQGEQLGFWNVREYILFRDGHRCQYCSGKSKDLILNVHHIESRKTGGNAPDNLITLCETCHHKIHREKLEHLFQRKRESFRDASQITVMRWFIYQGIIKNYPQAKITYGYETKNTRIKSGLLKSHRVDARCISGNPLTEPPDTIYQLKQVRKNNRQLHKANIRKGGLRPANIAPKYVYGYRLFDKVKFQWKEGFIFGRRSSGYFDIRLIDGTKVHASANVKHLKKLEHAKTILWERSGVSTHA